MTKILYIYRLLSFKNEKRRIAFFLPWIGILIGTTMLLLVNGIMSGMENEIFSSLNKIEKEYHIENFSNSDLNDILFYLDNNNYDYEIVNTRDVIIANKDNYMLVNMIAKNNEGEKKSNKILIGGGISNQLGIKENDSILVFSPLDINFSSFKIPSISYVVDSIYNTPVVGFDEKYVFTSSLSIENIINSNKKILINNTLTLLELEEIKNKFPEINISHWEDDYLELISAIRLEKIMYSFFAYLLILISCLGNFTISNFIITNKLKEISIFNILGFQAFDIKKTIHLIMSFFTLISSIIGIVLFILLIQSGAIDPLISLLFPDSLFYNFLVSIEIEYPVIILVLNLLTVYLSSLMAINVIGKKQAIDIIRGNLE